MAGRNAEAAEIAARLGEHPELLGDVLVILGALDVIRGGSISRAAAESVTVLRDAQQAAQFALDFHRALDEWILE